MARAQGAPPRPAPGLWQTAAGTPDVFPPPSQRNFKETPMKSPCADLRLKSSLDKRAAQESRPPIKSTVVRCALPVLPPPVSRVPPLQGAPPPGRSRRIANLTFWAVGKRDFYRSFLKSKAARPFAYRRQKSYNDSLRRHYPRQVKGSKRTLPLSLPAPLLFEIRIPRGEKFVKGLAKSGGKAYDKLTTKGESAGAG